MFGFASVAQLSFDIRSQVHRIPRDVDLVVGIPRSGMIPAYLIGLFRNKLVVDLETFLANGSAGHGTTRAVGATGRELMAARHVLLVDDSLASGGSMRSCVDRVRKSPFAGRMTTCAAIVDPSMGGAVDVFFRRNAATSHLRVERLSPSRGEKLLLRLGWCSVRRPVRSRERRWPLLSRVSAQRAPALHPDAAHRPHRFPHVWRSTGASPRNGWRQTACPTERCT